ncbi:MAG TPA: dihydroneopterin aldolase [Acidimicrobiia bacterium]|jgi:dihydroneopterin aldolase
MSGGSSPPAADSIRLTGIEVFAYHGVLESEKAAGQRFLVDVELFLDLSSAAASDRLEETVDYGDLANRIGEVATGQSRNLIETVAGEVADLCLEDPRVQEVVVAVHKPEAPLAVEFGDVTVTVRRRRR